MSIEEMQIPTLSNADQDSKKWEQLSEEVEVGNYDFEAFKDEESYQNRNEISEDQLRQAKERFAAEVQQKRGKGVLGFIRRRIA